MWIFVIRITSTADNGWYEIVKSLYATDTANGQFIYFSWNLEKRILSSLGVIY